MQAIYMMSDDPKAEYPFLKVPRVSIFAWILIYAMWPYYFYKSLKYWESRKPDVNCIKKHPFFVTGNLNVRLSKVFSMKRAKEAAKKMGITFNDLVTGIITVVIKEHFVRHGDNTQEITI